MIIKKHGCTNVDSTAIKLMHFILLESYLCIHSESVKKKNFKIFPLITAKSIGAFTRLKNSVGSKPTHYIWSL